jgi:exo-1,4-beta-D-glucosaminidase
MSWTARVSVVLLLGRGLASAAHAATVGSTELTSAQLRSAANVTDGGVAISQVGYGATGWYPITLPSTVLAGLVANNVYQNIYFGTNLKSVPDLTGQNWWYRGEFTAPASSSGQAYWLRFKGISYRAQIWLNGTQLLDANAVGTMVAHEYNVTSLVRPGAWNAVVFVRPEVTAGNGVNEVVPVSYTDNHVTLWPGDSTTITATYDTADLGGQAPYLRLRGWNLPTTSAAVP